MDQFIQVYEKAFSDEFCNEVIKQFKLGQELKLTVNRQEFDVVPKLEKEDNSLFLTNGCEFPM
jgi:hypothetical protein